MARLHTCGFEENDLTLTMWNALTGSVSIVTTSPHSGTYYAQTAGDTANNYIDRHLSASKTTGTLWTRLYVKISTRPSTDDRTILAWYSLGQTLGPYVRVDADGTLDLVNNVTGTVVAGSQVLATTTWYRLELQYVLSDTVGSLELRIYEGDSTTALETLTISSEDTLPGSIQIFRTGQITFAAYTVQLDDIAINDESGTFQNTWPGPGKIALLKPNTEVSIAWTPNTGTDNSANADDVPGAPDEDTTYNSSATANNEDRYGLTAMPAEVPSDATITLANVYARMRGEGTTAVRQCRVLIWDEGGTQTNGPTTGINDGTAYRIMDTAEHLVLDTSGKTKANLDSFDAGAEPLTNHATRLTALWVNVEWKEAVSSVSPPPPTIVQIEANHRSFSW